MDAINVHEDCHRNDGIMMKSLNNNFTASNNDKVDPKLDYKGYILTNCSTLTSAYQQPVETSTTDAQKRSLAIAPKTVIPNRANSGIVLITAKLNQSDESKLIQYNVSGSSGITSTNKLSKANLDKLNSVRVAATEDLTLIAQKHAAFGSDEQQQQPKTATILVSKSKTKTGLPLLLKKSK